MNYQSFIESKKHSLGEFGFKANYIPDMAFDFQSYTIEKAILRGRNANFLDTGLGKTLIQIALAVWDDIRIDNVLQHKTSDKKKLNEDDEKHVHALQLDVIDRLVELYSNPNEVVLTPFMGVGSEVYSPVSMGRKAIGIELKDAYYRQAILNLKNVENRFKNKVKQEKLF